MATHVAAQFFPRSAARAEARAQGTEHFRLLRAWLAATLLAAPLAFGAVEPWAWGALAVAAFLLLLAWAMAQARTGRLTIAWSPLYLPGACFFLIGLIQFIGGVTLNPLATREALIKLSADFVFFFLVGQMARGGAGLPMPVANGAERRHSPANTSLASGRWAIVLYTFALALFAILQFFSSDGSIYWLVKSPGWTFGPYVNHNHYAGLAEMLIPLAIACALPSLRQRRARGMRPADGNVAPGLSPARAALGSGHGGGIAPGDSRRISTSNPPLAIVATLILIPLASLLLSGSRGGVLAFLAEALLAAALIFIFGPRRMRRLTILAGGSALLAAGLLFFWMAPRHLAARLARMGGGAHASEAELGHRPAATRDTLRIFRDHPLVGVGLGSFESAFPRYQTFPSDFRWDHAHNDYAEALAETGVAGGAAIAAAIAMFFWLAFRDLRERLRHRAGWIEFAAAIGCCGILVHSLADFNLHMPANAAVFAACAALATSRRKSTTGGEAQTISRQDAKTPRHAK